MLAVSLGHSRPHHAENIGTGWHVNLGQSFNAVEMLSVSKMTEQDAVVSANEVTYPDALGTEPEFPLGQRPLHEYLEYYAEETPSKTAINYYGREISYAEWDRASDTLATYLATNGCERGDVLVLYLQNTPQIYISYYAAYKLGMRVCPCNPMSKRHALEHQIEDSGGEV